MCISVLGCPNEISQTEWLKQQQFIVSQVLAGLPVSEGCEKGTVLSVCRLLVNPGLVEASPPSLTSPPRGVLLMCLSVSKFPPFVRTCVPLNWGQLSSSLTLSQLHDTISK